MKRQNAKRELGHCACTDDCMLQSCPVICWHGTHKTGGSRICKNRNWPLSQVFSKIISQSLLYYSPRLIKNSASTEGFSLGTGGSRFDQIRLNQNWPLFEVFSTPIMCQSARFFWNLVSSKECLFQIKWDPPVLLFSNKEGQTCVSFCFFLIRLVTWPKSWIRDYRVGWIPPADQLIQGRGPGGRQDFFSFQAISRENPYFKPGSAPCFGGGLENEVGTHRYLQSNAIQRGLGNVSRWKPLYGCHGDAVCTFPFVNTGLLLSGINYELCFLLFVAFSFSRQLSQVCQFGKKKATWKKKKIRTFVTGLHGVEWHERCLETCIPSFFCKNAQWAALPWDVGPVKCSLLWWRGGRGGGAAHISIRWRGVLLGTPPDRLHRCGSACVVYCPLPWSTSLCEGQDNFRGSEWHTCGDVRWRPLSLPMTPAPPPLRRTFQEHWQGTQPEFHFHGVGSG